VRLVRELHAGGLALDDARVAHDLRGRRVRDDLAELERDDALGQLHDHAHVVLDDEERLHELADGDGGVAK